MDERRYSGSLRAGQITILVALLASVVLIQTPSGPTFFHVLQKLAHPAVFGLCSLLILSLRRRPGDRQGRSDGADYASAFAITLALGAVTEVAQHFTHRDPSITDVARDGLGAATALSAQWLLATRIGRPRRQGIRLVAGLICACGLAVVSAPMAWCLAAYANRDLRFPVLWQLNSALDLYFLNGPSCESRSLWGLWRLSARPISLCVPLPSTEPSPGIALGEPYPDWQGRSVLTIDVSNPMPSPLRLMVRVHDRNHNQAHEDRFNRAYVIAGGTRQVISIPLEEIAAAPHGRRMDLRHIAHIGIFRSGGAGDGFLVLHRISLQ
jgi:VanZ family protein